ncbi:unnamed protein product, partial [Staurois parvus]
LTSLAVFPSVVQAVTPSYTPVYHTALLRDLFFSYLVLRSRDISPAVSPVMSSGRCWHLSSEVGTYGDATAGNLKMTKSDIH